VFRSNVMWSAADTCTAEGSWNQVLRVRSYASQPRLQLVKASAGR
jgi:hypothetical protein